MKFYTDLHLHSHFSRATSKQLNLEHLSKWAQLKGIQVIGTGDFVHPGWLQELETKLESAEAGFFKLKPEYARLTENEVPAACRGTVRFLLSAEISNIYKRLDRVRKVHNIIFAPNFETAKNIQARLEAIGNIRSDGRPILGLDSRDLLEITLDADPLAFLIPAHIWTPWFSALGSKGGFDRMADCFGDLTAHIFAVETGLSSDPLMNWRLTQLDPYVLVSNSDAHSPQKLAREATIYETDFSYHGIYSALADPTDPGLVGTIEFFPEEGKYHFDGHRKCQTRMHPRETIANQGLCPVCGKLVTVGVMARVEELADRPEGEKPPRARPFFNLIPLPEIIAEARNVGVGSNAVQLQYQQLLAKIGNELFILQDAPIEDIRQVGGALVAEGVRRMRAGDVHIAAGYDGDYGVIRIFSPEERKELGRQASFLTADSSSPETSADAIHATAAEASEIPETAPLLEDAAIDSAAFSQPETPPEPTDAHIGEKLSVQEPVAAYHPQPATYSGPDIQLGSQLPPDVNPAQWRAVTHGGSRHLLIVAGPGTGKTHTLTYRIAHVAQCFAAPQDILAITFTNKAAEEMRERLYLRLNDQSEAITVGTFHSFCLQFLRRHADLSTTVPVDFSIATPEDLDDLAKTLWAQDIAGERRHRVATISRWKSTGYTENAPADVVAYDRLLRAHGLLDFDDLLLETLRVLRENALVREQAQLAYRYIFVDEYQDINQAQHALLLEMVQNGVQLTAIGDPNQAIYGFRGSDVGFFASFAEDFPGAQTLFLAENYRSATDLLSASGQVIRKGGSIVVPALTAKILAKGRLTIYESPTVDAEAEYVVHQIEKLVGGTSMFSQDSGRVASEAEAERSFADIAVLYRLNNQSAALTEALERSGIPFQVSGDTPLIAKTAVAEMVSMLRLADDQPVRCNLVRRLLEFVAEGIGAQSGAALEAFWRSKSVQVTRADVQAALTHDDLLNDRARTAVGQFLAEIDELAQRMHEAGIIAALQHLIILPGWQRLFASRAHITESWQRLVRLARLRSGLGDFLDYLLLQRDEDGRDEAAEKVSLMTIHAAKGLEFPVVFIVGCEQQLLPLQLEGWHSDAEEERRLFYVGMTRAREQLFLVRAARRSLFGKSYETAVSPFLADIEEQLKVYDKIARRQRRRDLNLPQKQMDLFGNEKRM